jgi:hypothetical protein
VTNFVDQFQRLVRLLVKWTLIAVVAVVSVTGVIAAGIYGWGWWSHDRHAALVQVTATIDPNECRENPAQPILVTIENRSTKTIEETQFDLVGKRPRRSSDVTTYHLFEVDYIIAPKERLRGCFSAVLIEDAKGEDLRSLEWSTRYTTVRFAE